MGPHRLNSLTVSASLPLAMIARAMLLCALAASFFGCSHKYVEVRDTWYLPASLEERFAPHPPLSERTQLVLRRFDLARFGVDSEEAIAGLVDVYCQEPSLEVAFALAEADLRDRIKNKMIRPTTIPQLLQELKIEKAIAREALRLAHF